jgi:hypothetical protein
MPYGQIQVDTVKDSLNNTFAPASSVFRNRIINGAMYVAQYGTSSTAGGYCCVDRWKCNKAGTAPTFSQTGVTLNGISNQALQVTGIAGNTGVNIQQNIELKNCYDLVGQSVTVSFWVQQTTGSSFSLQTSLAYPTGADNFNTTTIFSTNTTSIPNSTWTFVSFTVNNLPSNVNNGLQLFFLSNSPAITSGSFYFTLVQLEAGINATNFDYRPYGTELALCQRYYAKMISSTAVASFGSGYVNSSTQALYYLKYPMTMRASPTFSYSNVAIDSQPAAPTVTSAGTTYAGTDTLSVVLNGSGGGLTAGQATVLRGTTTTSYVDFSAEL